MLGTLYKPQSKDSDDIEWDAAGQDKCFTGRATNANGGGLWTASVCSSLAREAETVSDACSCPPSLVACLALRWNLLFAAEWLPVIRSGPFLGLLKARDQENKNMKWQRNLKVAAHRRTCDFPVEGRQTTYGHGIVERLTAEWMRRCVEWT